MIDYSRFLVRAQKIVGIYDGLKEFLERGRITKGDYDDKMARLEGHIQELKRQHSALLRESIESLPDWSAERDDAETEMNSLYILNTDDYIKQLKNTSLHTVIQRRDDRGGSVSQTPVVRAFTRAPTISFGGGDVPLWAWVVFFLEVGFAAFIGAFAGQLLPTGFGSMAVLILPAAAAAIIGFGVGLFHLATKLTIPEAASASRAFTCQMMMTGLGITARIAVGVATLVLMLFSPQIAALFAIAAALSLIAIPFLCVMRVYNVGFWQAFFTQIAAAIIGILLIAAFFIVFYVIIRASG